MQMQASVTAAVADGDDAAVMYSACGFPVSSQSNDDTRQDDECSLRDAIKREKLDCHAGPAKNPENQLVGGYRSSYCLLTLHTPLKNLRVKPLAKPP